MSFRRVPFVRFQQSETDCGIACVSMLLASFGRRASMENLRDMVSWGRDGTSVAAITELLEGLGVRYAVESVDDIGYFRRDDFEGPCMVHWRFSHWVVVEGAGRKGFSVVDPQRGRYMVSPEEYSSSFTGILIRIVGTDYERVGRLARLRSLISRMRSIGGVFIPFVDRKRLGLSVAAALIVQAIPGLGAWLTATLFSRMSVGLDRDTAITCCLSLLAFGIGSGLAMFSRGIASAQLGADLRMSIGVRLLSAFLNASFRYVQGRSIGDVVNRIVGVQVVQNLLSNVLLTVMFDLTSTVVYVVVLLLLWTEAGVYVCLLLVAYAVFLFFSGRRMYHLSVASVNAASTAQSELVGICSAAEAIKLAQAERRISSNWRFTLGQEVFREYRFLRFQAMLQAAGVFVQQVLPLCILVYGAFRFTQGSVSIGLIAGVNSLLGSLFGSAMMISYTAQQILSSGVVLERVRDLLHAPQEISRDMSSEGIGAATFSQSLTLSHVVKRYGGSSYPVLSDVSLTVRPGDFIGIKGRTGAGKTTLLRTIVCLEDIEGGDIRFDGVSKDELTVMSVRSLFGVVSQEPQIMAGSLRYNLTLGVDGVFSDDLLFEALEVVELAQEVRMMPMGLDTVIGDSGAGLSGGQCQRLAIGRAVLRDCSVLVLDEATSALDLSTEVAVVSKLRRRGVAVICATHRDSTLRSADAVYELAGGKLTRVCLC
ncbi:ATP-binding cassette domain-containing protein [Actinomyces sp. 594]|uniref:peptidase domain-containing ABC transporter n=1 Tax=Actinomyces sp. 594 TaxID=2057793 RepID=UPI001C5841A0|nr:cysteine peptidase family C39 domain-containing protein [Actinomyces sp. 594]MBW3069710.1 ATP-binding cassette domain-containing protein [Actinomyces sp. 594]